MPIRPSKTSNTIRARRYRAFVPAILGVLLYLASSGSVLFAQGRSAEGKPANNPELKQPDKKPESEKAGEPKNGVVLTGHLSRDSARPDGKIRFWITIENKTAGSIRNLRVADFFTPGFDRPPQLSGGCSGATWGLVCGSLAPQETVAIWGDLSASESAPKESAYAVLVWDSDTRPGQSSVVQLGEIERLSWYAATWRWLAQLNIGLDIGLPTLTAVLVGLYGFLKRRKEKREAAAKEAQEKYQQTWNLMLPQANRFSLQYYIPTANSIVTGIYNLTACRKENGATDENLLAAFFDLVQIQWHRLRMKRAIGGYYFKSRTAETVMEGLFQKHRTFFEVATPDRLVVLTKFVKPLRRSYELGDFRADRTQWDAEQKKFWKEFVSWVPGDNCREDLKVLGAMGKVLWYESNRPFFNWYQEQPPVVLTSDEGDMIDAVGADLLKDDTSMPLRVTSYKTEITTGIAARNPA